MARTRTRRREFSPFPLLLLLAAIFPAVAEGAGAPPPLSPAVLYARQGATAGVSPVQNRAQPRRLDSLAAIEAALTAQRIFERVRLAHMPYGPSAGRSQHCDEFIGRFCYEYGDRSEDTDDTPEEAEPVKRARAQFLRILDSLNRNSAPSGVLIVPETTSSGTGLAGIETSVMTNNRVGEKGWKSRHGRKKGALFRPS